MVGTTRSSALFALAAVLIPSVAAIGCSAGSMGGSGATAQAKAAIRDFLEAIKRGDDTAARGMLTEVARAKTAEMGLAIAPPVPATATYSIRDCEPIGDTGEVVHVSTTWTDTDADGFTTTDEVIWVTRLDPEGWRVVGMAMKVFDDAPPLLLNFEDPEDMIAKQRSVAMEIQRRAKAAASQAGASPKAPASAGTPPGPAQSNGVRTGAAQPVKTVQ